MRVLLMESDPGASDAVATALTERGDDVVRCADRPGLAFPCHGVVDLCPLDEGVDLALLLRPAGRVGQSELESGVSCAIRHRVPLVVAGEGDHDQYGRFATARVATGGVGEILAGLDAVASEGAVEHVQVVERALAERLTQLGLPSDRVRVNIERATNGDLRVELTPSSLPEHVVGQLADRSHQALRGFDPYATKIEVLVRAG